MDEQSLLWQALVLSQTLRDYPAEQLRPFLSEIEQLSTVYGRLCSKIKTDPTGPHRDSPAAAASSASHLHQDLQSPFHDARLPASGPREEPQVPRRTSNASRNLLDTSIRLIPSIYNAVWQFSKPRMPDPRCSARALHIANILTLQGRRLAIAEGASEKILVLCASLSLAKDFHDFELRGGWKPKQILLVERIKRGEDPGVQSVAKTVKRYIASQNVGSSSGQQKLEAALRLGIKLSIVDDIGREKGIQSLSLLLGFAYYQFARLSFSNIALLRHELEINTQYPDIAAFAANIDRSWMQCQAEYHAQFGDASSHSLANPSGRGVSHVAPLQHAILPPTETQSGNNDLLKVTQLPVGAELIPVNRTGSVNFGHNASRSCSEPTSFDPISIDPLPTGLNWDHCDATYEFDEWLLPVHLGNTNDA